MGSWAETILQTSESSLTSIKLCSFCQNLTNPQLKPQLVTPNNWIRPSELMRTKGPPESPWNNSQDSSQLFYYIICMGHFFELFMPFSFFQFYI